MYNKNVIANKSYYVINKVIIIINNKSLIILKLW